MQNYQCRGIEFYSSLQTGNELRNEVRNISVKSDLKSTITQNIFTTFVQRIHFRYFAVKLPKPHYRSNTPKNV